MAKRNILLGLFLALTLCLAPSNASAAGLSTGFSEVTLENLKPGKTYSTKEAAGLSLTVVNTGEEPVDLKMDILIPEEAELKEGFEPIPDLLWIKLEKAEFKGIGPKNSAVTDVVILIPDNKEYLGKRYQVFIWSHTIGRKIGVGLKSKLLLSITESPEETR